MSELLPKSVSKRMCESVSLRQDSPIAFVPPNSCSASEESGSRNQIKIKSGPGTKKQYPVFSGRINEAHILYLTNCNNVIQDKYPKAVILGWSKAIGKNQDELEYHELDKPANSPFFSTKPTLKKKKN